MQISKRSRRVWRLLSSNAPNGRLKTLFMKLKLCLKYGSSCTQFLSRTKRKDQTRLLHQMATQEIFLSPSTMLNKLSTDPTLVQMLGTTQIALSYFFSSQTLPNLLIWKAISAASRQGLGLQKHRRVQKWRRHVPTVVRVCTQLKCVRSSCRRIRMRRASKPTTKTRAQSPSKSFNAI